MKPQLKHTVLACAIVQAFSIPAFAQSNEQASGQAVPEVVVTGSRWIGSDHASVGGFADTPLLETPASVIAINRQQMQDLSIRSTTDAMKYDASVSDAYNAVGYAEQFSIRGFNLDNNSSYRKDGIMIPADTEIPLENKERIEVLKGLSGLTAGVSAPGGIVNYVTKRPTAKPLRSATVEVSERGTLYGSADIGGRFDDPRFGYRINAAAENIHSYVRGADGHRNFVSGAFDWQVTGEALLQLDFDYQHKSQVSAPGYQLVRNAVLPANVDPAMLLNDQPWAYPVDTRSTNLGLRFEYKLAPDWLATVNANKHWFKRDDYTAFPYGCSNEGDGFYPGFCSNGDYDVYDYISLGERKSPWGAQAQVQGKFATGALRHSVVFGTAYSERHDSWGDYVYDYVGSSNIYQNRIVPPVPADRTSGPVSEQFTSRERALFAQDIVNLSQQLTLHAGLRHEQVKRVQAGTDDSFLLPSVALVYGVLPNWNVYGSISHGMEFGGTAPMGTTNENTTLAPSRSKQLEVGVKGIVNQAMTLSAALFQIRKGLEYTDSANTFVRNGEETHRGLELGAQGKPTTDLSYSISLMALNTKQEGTGQASIDGKRVSDVPAFKSSALVEYALPQVPGLKLDGTWQYSGKKAFDVENRVFVPGYHVFGVGAAYAINAGVTRVTVRARVDNLFDKFYWRDVTPELGGYLFPGAPRTFRLSAQVDF